MGIGHKIDRVHVGVVTIPRPHHRPGFHSQRTLFSRSTS
jgi:hypothetical protein